MGGFWNGLGNVASGIARRGPAIADLTGRVAGGLGAAVPGIGGSAPMQPIQQSGQPNGFDAIRNDLSQIRSGPGVKYNSNARAVQNNPAGSSGVAAPQLSLPSSPAPRF
jgi:hypothetical protein